MARRRGERRVQKTRRHGPGPAAVRPADRVERLAYSIVQAAEALGVSASTVSRSVVRDRRRVASRSRPMRHRARQRPRGRQPVRRRLRVRAGVGRDMGAAGLEARAGARRAPRLGRASRSPATAAPSSSERAGHRRPPRAPVGVLALGHGMEAQHEARGPVRDGRRALAGRLDCARGGCEDDDEAPTLRRNAGLGAVGLHDEARRRRLRPRTGVKTEMVGQKVTITRSRWPTTGLWATRASRFRASPPAPRPSRLRPPLQRREATALTRTASARLSGAATPQRRDPDGRPPTRHSRRNHPRIRSRSRMTEFMHPTCATNVERWLVDVGEVP